MRYNGNNVNVNIIDWFVTNTLPNLEYFSSKWHSLGDLSASCTEVTCVNDECHCRYEAYVRNVKTRAYREKAYIVSLKNVDLRKNDRERLSAFNLFIGLIFRIYICSIMPFLQKDFQPHKFELMRIYRFDARVNNKTRVNTFSTRFERIFSTPRVIIYKRNVRLDSRKSSSDLRRADTRFVVSLFHYHLNFPSLTRTGKSASFSGKKHRRKRHSALCCGHYLFRGIVKAVVIGGRGGEEARQEDGGWRRI